VLPHVFVLLFLWIALFVTTIVAGFAILFTGKYPRSIFDFNVGVMRWTWRASFYAINAFGTDRYPPFSLNSEPDYPADLTIDYPEHLARGLVLIKWWLLALPHLVIVGIFAGGFGFASGNLIGVLAIVAGAMLLFTGRYPQDLFDLLMGLNRWCYRVLAYVALMTDAYPPFRLDTGGTDPGSVPRTPPPVPLPRQPVTH
jgi:hypothetical protein